MSGKIFISYRRDDSRYQARMIYEAFLRRMPRENVFMDIDTIPLGVNFVKVLEGWVEQCEVLLVLMGVGWANSTDPKTGKRRLDNPKDFVRVEIRGALTRDIPVVPVMLDGAEIPDEAQLPDDIKGLLSRNAEFVEYRNFDADVQRLLKKLGVGVSAKQTAAPATIAGTLRDQAIERSTRSSAEDFETQGDLADKAQAKKPLGKEWKRWLTPTVVAIVLLAAAVISALVFWSQGPMSGKKGSLPIALTAHAKPPNYMPLTPRRPDKRPKRRPLRRPLLWSNPSKRVKPPKRKLPMPIAIRQMLRARKPAPSRRVL